MVYVQARKVIIVIGIKHTIKGTNLSSSSTEFLTFQKLVRSCLTIHNHIYTDTNKGNGPAKNHVQLQRTITRDEELEDVQTLVDNPSRKPFLGYGRASTTVDILAKLLTGPPLYHRRRQ